MKRIAIFLSGRGSNFLAIARQCQAGGILHGVAEIALVFSNNPAAKGLETATELGISTLSIASKGKKRKTFDQAVVDALESYALDYIVLAGYMRILSPILVNAYPQRIINIHPADTRAFQGLGGYEWAFEQGLEETKVTVHYVDEGVDTGNIIQQATVDLKGATTLEEVEKRGLAVEHQLYSEALRALFITEV